jgi:hypothetical protein
MEGLNPHKFFSGRKCSNIPEDVKDRLSEFLRNKKALDKAQKEMMITILDYAGQHVCYATHQTYISKASFTICFFSAAQPLDGYTPSVFRIREGEIVRITLFDIETNFDRLFEWMSAIDIMESDYSQQMVLFDELKVALLVMFLVGTHADQLRKQSGRLKRQEKF